MKHLNSNFGLSRISNQTWMELTSVHSCHVLSLIWSKKEKYRWVATITFWKCQRGEQTIWTILETHFFFLFFFFITCNACVCIVLLPFKVVLFRINLFSIHSPFVDWRGGFKKVMVLLVTEHASRDQLYQMSVKDETADLWQPPFQTTERCVFDSQRILDSLLTDAIEVFSDGAFQSARIKKIILSRTSSVKV